MNNTSTATSESARLREVCSKMLGLHPTLLEMDRNRFVRLDFGKVDSALPPARTRQIHSELFELRA
jgi:hypothetical protein